ncbi:MAG: hypothetical protein K8R21_16580, partial [Leptospira sp.]|nr:hypothetical protein [Leptospira sp.]
TGARRVLLILISGIADGVPRILKFLIGKSRDSKSSIVFLCHTLFLSSESCDDRPVKKIIRGRIIQFIPA